ncbi:MAG: acyltransferase [Gemmatimonadaceae bacterium]|jgi:acetyltransferase-like isoleucine patch superfamily enzyme
MRPFRSHGTGRFVNSDLSCCGRRVIFEDGVLIFHPERVYIADDVYVGHQTILKGYHEGILRIGAGAWIGQQCFLHAAGDITIEEDVGIGPAVKILTSRHREPGRDRPIMAGDIELSPVVLEAGCDLGVGAIIMPGVRIGRGAQIGAGAVVTHDVPPYAIAAGVPARVLRERTAEPSEDRIRIFPGRLDDGSQPKQEL